MKLNTEAGICEYLKENWEKIFPHTFKDLKFEYGIPGWHSNKRIGAADIYFKAKGKSYICEVKHVDVNPNAFWDSLKVLGYVASLELAQPNVKWKPCVVLDKKVLTADKLPILYNLNVSYITYARNKHGIQFEYYL